MNHQSPTASHPTPYSTPMAVDAASKPRRNWILIALLVILLGPIALMVGIVFLLAIVGTLGRAVDHEQASIPAEATLVSSRSTGVAASGPGHSDIVPTAFQFQGQTFSLKSSTENESTGTLHEYIPEGETLERWSKLISICEHPIDAEPAAMAYSTADSLLQMNPQAPYAIWHSGDGSTSGIDFAIWQGDIAEFNVFIYTRSQNGTGIVSHQYAERAYADQVQPFLEGLPQRRGGLIEQATSFRFPSLIGKP
ncbi:hypothetical protein [Stieleria sp.]|uniref:hypothetical protein n=1 Tax=Stieleria sp. TaxID=2795976 RepID=UPI003562A319